METILLQSLLQNSYEATEAYRTLKTNVQLLGKHNKVIAVTSVQPGEGKSTVNLNLAAALAEGNNKVLFIDADMRKSVLEGRLKIDKKIMGLSDWLAGICKGKDILYATEVPGLQVIFAGTVPPKPTELLDNEMFGKLIEVSKNAYDYIIIDTPPLGTVIDAAIIAKYCDGMILLVSAGDVSYKEVRKVKKQIEKTNCRLLGYILNKVTSKK